MKKLVKILNKSMQSVEAYCSCSCQHISCKCSGSSSSGASAGSTAEAQSTNSYISSSTRSSASGR